MHPLIGALVAILVVAAGITDIRSRRIPNLLVLPAIPLGLALNLFLPGLHIKDAAIGFGLAVLIYMPLYALRGMGAGDVKLAAALGAFLGPNDFLWVFILSGIVGLVLALVVMVVQGRVHKTLWNTAYIAWELMHMRAPHHRSEELDVKSSKGLRLPYGVVLALGTLTLLGIRLFHVA